MRVFEWPILWTIVVDFAAWFIFHMAAALLALHLPDRWFTADRWPYRTGNWERGGQVWQDVFKVRTWKERLPDGALMLGRGYVKKRLQASHASALDDFIRESRRAELTHYLAATPAVLFFLWNPPWAGWVMIVYAILANAPCIIAQRYNRPRFARIREQKRRI